MDFDNFPSESVCHETYGIHLGAEAANDHARLALKLFENFFEHFLFCALWDCMTRPFVRREPAPGDLLEAEIFREYDLSG